MIKDGRIPVVIGVTGHRNLREDDISILKEAVRAEIGAVCSKCPDTEVIVMTGLAEGADMLCAETALEMGLEIVSILPMPIEDYSEDFEDAGPLHELADRSAAVFTAPFLEPFEPGRDYLYRQAGLYIAKHCHVLFSLWDGVPASPGGCGTASITDVKLNTSYDEASGSHLHPADGIVIRIAAQRQEVPEDGIVSGSVVCHGDMEKLDKMLADTDMYNKDCLLNSAGAAEEEPGGGSGADPVMSKLDAVYEMSDSMSVSNAVRHRRVLAALSVSATLLALAFLLYDEVEWTWMMLVCGILIVLLLTINRITGKLLSHRKYLEYRVLAEVVRVQRYLRTAGIPCEVSDIMPWSIQVTIPWVRHAVPAIVIGEPASEKNSILDCWVRDQKVYHQKALAKTETQLTSNDRIVKTALVLTLFIYVSALIFEIGWGGMLTGTALVSGASAANIRLFIKIAMGTFSCGTLFAGNYYGKQALPDVMDDHRKMILLYEEAEREIAVNGETENLLVRLAEDELSENSNWYAYQSKHEPELGI